MKKQITSERLFKLNVAAAVLHAVQGCLILALSKGFSIPVTGSYLAFDTSTQSLNPANTVLFNISVPALVAGFLFMSSVAHIIVATVYRKKYVDNLGKGINKARWIEYSVSASTMIVAISLLVGVYDFVSLICLFVLISVMNLTGLIMEVHNQTTKKTSWLSYYVGCLAGAVPWVAIAFYFWLSASNGSSPPTFVYWIFVSIFTFFSCFAINMILQYKKIGPWKDYIYGERAYIILSLVAKSLLAWQVFAGTLRP